MRDMPSADPSAGNRMRHDRRTPPPIELWCLRGATDDLRGLVFETSFGYALGLELDDELVLLHLQPNLERLVEYSDRIHSALCGQGWLSIEEPCTRPRSPNAR
jgi:hypothetical protein